MKKTDGFNDKLKNQLPLLKKFSNNIKIYCIPPLLQGNKYTKYFKKKSELFNFFFTAMSY